MFQNENPRIARFQKSLIADFYYLKDNFILQGSLFRQPLRLRGRHQAAAGGGEAGADPAGVQRPRDWRRGGEQGQVPLPEGEVAQCDGRV